MTIQYKSLTSYEQRRFEVISLVECIGGHPNLIPYSDHKGYPTIGIGFKIDSNLIAILAGMGFNTTQNATATEKSYIAQIDKLLRKYPNVNEAGMSTLQSKLDQIMAARAQQYGISRNKFEYLSNAEVKTTYDLIVEDTYEKRLSGWLGETNTTMYSVVPKSFERIALLSLTYNGYIGSTTKNGIIVPVGCPSLRKAILGGNRAEAWYEIRYNSLSKKSSLEDNFGVEKRHFFEAELFGGTEA